MRATELLALQLSLIHARIEGLADMSRDEWLARPSPGDNPAGFIAWHIVATRDWVVRAMLQARRPIGWDAPFAGTSIGACAIPFGMSPGEADAIAEATTPAGVIAYSRAVTDEIVRWLGTIEDAALDLPAPVARQHLALSPRYDERAYRHELEEDPADMCLWPAWQLLTRPAFTHSLGHLTEIAIARAGAR